ncbi:hypothetical protein EAF04_009471 [Stromatinia cepivora]|nr:hypothetical protein EAF04_009471 [Stromatinia cepivora]
MTDPSNGSSGSSQSSSIDKPLPAQSPLYDPFAGKTFEARSIVYWTDPTTLSSSQTRTQSVHNQQRADAPLPISISAIVVKKCEKPAILAFIPTSADQSRKIAYEKARQVEDWCDIMLSNGVTKKVNGKELSWRLLLKGFENSL